MSVNLSRLYLCLINAMNMLCENRSTGATVVEMLTGKPPWHTYNLKVTVVFKIVSEETKPNLPEECSVAADEFVSQCFIK